MNMDTGAHRGPVFAESDARGSFVTACSIMSGVPIDPNATGAVFANRHIAAAKNGGKPRHASTAAAPPSAARGSQTPARACKAGHEGEAYPRPLNPWTPRHPADGVFQNFEFAGFD